jgi:hypothetical protein
MSDVLALEEALDLPTAGTAGRSDREIELLGAPCGQPSARDGFAEPLPACPIRSTANT